MHLIKFNDLHSKERQGISSEKASSAKAHRFPGIIRDKFASMFDAVSGSLSTKKRNLLISYVLVLTLFADEFQTSLTDIATDLRMKSPDLRKHYEALGCKVSKKNNLLTVTLPVPLQFPSLKRKRSNRWIWFQWLLDSFYGRTWALEIKFQAYLSSVKGFLFVLNLWWIDLPIYLVILSCYQNSF